MRYSTTQQFQLINFHDSVIDKIEHEHKTINLHLAFANLHAGHIENTKNNAVSIKPCILTFTGIKSTEAKVFDDKGKVYRKHPEPASPLDSEILETSILSPNGAFADSGLTGYGLKGFHAAGWSEWEIWCEGFELQWDVFDGEAWWVNWPPISKGPNAE